MILNFTNIKIVSMRQIDIIVENGVYDIDYVPKINPIRIKCTLIDGMQKIPKKFTISALPICEISTRLGNTEKTFEIGFTIPIKGVYKKANFLQSFFFGKTEIFTGKYEIDKDKFHQKLNETLEIVINKVK